MNSLISLLSEDISLEGIFHLSIITTSSFVPFRGTPCLSRKSVNLLFKMYSLLLLQIVSTSNE